MDFLQIAKPLQWKYRRKNSISTFFDYSCFPFLGSKEAAERSRSPAVARDSLFSSQLIEWICLIWRDYPAVRVECIVRCHHDKLSKLRAASARYSKAALDCGFDDLLITII